MGLSRTIRTEMTGLGVSVSLVTLAGTKGGVGSGMEKGIIKVREKMTIE